MAKIKVAIVTGSRADFGMLQKVIVEIKKEARISSSLIVTGSHSSSFGSFSNEEINSSRLKVDWKMSDYIDGDNPEDKARLSAKVILDVTDAFEALRPGLVLLLGDRFEIHAVATAAYLMGIRIARIHGGELTLGSLDDSLRHAISKLSHYHFVSTIESKNRLIQLGEDQKGIFVVGGLGAEKIASTSFLSKQDVENELGFTFGKRNLLIAYHSNSASRKRTEDGINELLEALKLLPSTKLLFTYPNTDSFSSIVVDKIKRFVESNSNSTLIPSMGAHLYLSCVQYVDGVLGNSSSGILEVPSFKKGTINLGDRQHGRVMSESVISCAEDRQEIMKSIERLYSKEFQVQLLNSRNPYFKENTSKSIVEILMNVASDEQLHKNFIDLKSG